MTHSAIVGALLGTAVGDALGLPYENVSRRRGVRLLGEPEQYRFFFGRGMVSDDTEHTCIVAQALLASGGDGERFTRQLGWRLRWWLLSLPVGLGRATLLASLKLWCGFSPHRSGIYSAGNGPAMRSAILGAAIDDPQLLRQLVRISTRITHTDPQAEQGAAAVALAAYLARQHPIVEGPHYLEELRRFLQPDPADKFLAIMERVVRSVADGQGTLAFAEAEGWGKGVTGYVMQTVPVAVHAWLRHRHAFATAVTEVIRCGGDTDTMAAIVGGIIGAAVGKDGIPAAWLDRLFDWPRTVTWMEHLGHRLAEALSRGQAERPPRLSAVGLLGRNLLFLLLVLVHAGRRCLPPY
jgi:ADP-ribosylglycohydrolase